MGWDGGGGYDRTHNFSADASADIKILAARMDAEFNDVASAITNTWARDGQNEPSTNLPMGGNRFQNVGAAASVEDFLRAKEYIQDIPIFVQDEESVGEATIISVSTEYFLTASANASPPDGTRLRVRPVATKVSVSCEMRLRAGGGTSHIAQIYSRDTSFDPGTIREGHIHDFVYDASASAWRLTNPFVGYVKGVVGAAKCYNAAGTIAGVQSNTISLGFARIGNCLAISLRGSGASVSCSISARYLVLSASTQWGIPVVTDGIQSHAIVPIRIQDSITNWSGEVPSGGIGSAQVRLEAAYAVDGTTVSADTTVQLAPCTLLMLGTG